MTSQRTAEKIDAPAVISKQGVCERPDWVKHPGRLSLYWGLPVTVLILSSWVADPVVKTWAWVIALVWMGAACLMNASRCGRRHCYYTGPFFVVMAVIVWLHGHGVLGLGAESWWWLALAIGIGSGLLWYFPEHRWGQYVKQRGSHPVPNNPERER